MSDKIYDISEIEILYNIYGKFYYLIGRENKVDGDVLFYDLDTGEVLDLASFAEIGYKVVRSKRMLLNGGQFSLNDLKEIVAALENASLRKRELPDEYLIGINNVLDAIDNNRFNYDIRYPVEQLDARYSEVTGEYKVLYYEFDPIKKKFMYMDVTTGLEVGEEVLEMYHIVPREQVFREADYSPREVIEMLGNMNSKGIAYGKRGQRKKD